MNVWQGWHSARSGRVLGRYYPAAAMLVLGLLVAHLFLMAHEPRHDQHLAHDAPTSVAPMAGAALVAMPEAPAAPRSVLDGCPVAHATLPGVLLLLLLALVCGARRWFILPSAARMAVSLVRPPPAPPLAAQRRALLQVFLI